MKEERSNTNPGTKGQFNKASLPKHSLLESILAGAGQHLLSLAKFSGFIVTTSIADMEEGLKNGGELEIRRTQKLTRDPEKIPEWHLCNQMFSCFYLRSYVRDEVRETLHMIRRGFDGGAILQFTDGELVSGITNAVERIYFSPEEEEVAKRLLLSVRANTEGV